MFCFFFFNDTATTEIYTLSLHDALPISAVLIDNEHDIDVELPETYVGDVGLDEIGIVILHETVGVGPIAPVVGRDRKSTRLNSSHSQISYAVFCLKKKK